MEPVQDAYLRSHPQRYDLFKYMCASEFFVIDIDSLVMAALNNVNVDWDRLQILHVIYNVELLLKNLQVRGGVFGLAVFRCNEWMWDTDPAKRLVREAVISHLTANSPTGDVRTFPNWWDKEFVVYCRRSSPEFVLLTDAEDVPQVPLSDAAALRLVQHQFRTQGLHAINTLGISVVFTSRLRFRDSSAVGFVWRGVQNQFPELPEALAVIKGNSKTKDETLGAPLLEKDTLRASVTVRSVRDVVGTSTDAATLALARAFILHSALLETLPVTQRGFLINDGTPKAIEFFQKVSARAAAYLPALRTETPRGESTVSDLFDGRLFTHVVQCVVRGDLPAPPGPLAERAGALWKAIPGCGSQPLLPIPQADFGPLGEKELFPLVPDDLEDFPNLAETPVAIWMPKPQSLEKIDASYYGYEQELVVKRENFDRRVHYNAATLGEKPYNLQASREVEQRVIKGGEVKIMVANTLERVKGDIERRRLRLDTLIKEFPMKPFSQGYSSINDFIVETSAQASTFESEVQRIPGGPETVSLSSLLGTSYLQLLLDAFAFIINESGALWEKECDAAQNGGRQADRTKATLCFQLIHRAREVIEDYVKYITTDDIKKKVKKHYAMLRNVLSVFGLRDNVRIWEDLWREKHIDVPTPSLFIPEKDDFNVKTTSVRFQMNCMGERLERPRTAPDSRVPFRPDDWQRDLLNIVDNKESVVVCTPTSAGKTFVSFYCIKNVLVANTEIPGLIVYVCPTKALLRQALASIYVKFKEKRYESSWNVYGVLEDYAFMIEKCQALVTIPEAFEQLLLSTSLEHQLLMKRIQYVIFDEIHSIDDLRTGCVWERLLTMIRVPFIALSATVGNPDVLASWLQSVQTMAQQQQALHPQADDDRRFTVHLLPRKGKKIHRWSDLPKYAFRPVRSIPPKEGRTKVYDNNSNLDTSYHADSLIPLHPMSFLTLRKLQEDKQFPQDLPFLPREMLELFDAMMKNCSKKKTPEIYAKLSNELEPDTYFKRLKSPLVTQNSAREYEAILLQEFMSWVELASTNKDVKKLVEAVLEDLGSGTSFVLPRSNLRLFTAMSEAIDDAAGEDEEDDPIMDALYPTNFFRDMQEPSPDVILLHQYLLVSYLLYWERCSHLDNSSKHADLLGSVLKKFEVARAEFLPAPLGDLVYQIRQDALPHYNPKTAVKRTADPKIVDKLPADLATLYKGLNAACPPSTPNVFLDGLLPENFFGGGRSPSDARLLGFYRQLLVAEWIRVGKSVPLPSTLEEFAKVAEATTLPTDLGYLDVGAGDEKFLRLPFRKSDLPPPTTEAYVSSFLYELLVSLNTRDMLPVIVFNFDISEVERLAFSLCDQLEKAENEYRHSEEFQVMKDKIELLKKQKAQQEKIASARTRQGKGNKDDDEGGRDNRDHKVDLGDELQDLQSLITEIPPILPQFSFAKHGAGESSQKVQELIDEYVKHPSDMDRKYLRCLQRGIGVHHTGMSSGMCSLMEHLFRTLNLGVMISTTTLALGIHTPCRSVVLAGDDVQLTNVQFRQMAGRAGRRGLDFLGHVIMLGVPARKISRLMTSKLQSLRGHSIVDPSTSLQTRMMQNAVVSQVTHQKSLKRRTRKEFTDKFLDTIPAIVQDDIDRIHICSFLSACYSQGGLVVDDTMRRLWQTEFIDKYFQREGFMVDPSGLKDDERRGRELFAKMQTDMMVRAFHSYNNVRLNAVNTTMMALLRSGVLHEISQEFILNERALSLAASDSGDFNLNADMLTVLAYFLQIDEFGLPLEIHRSLAHPANGFEAKEHIVALRPLETLMSGRIAEELTKYTSRVIRQYSAFLEKASASLPAEAMTTLPFTVIKCKDSSSASYTLPSTLPPTRVRSPFIALSGKGDVFDSVEDLVASVSPLLQVDPSAIPAVDFIDVESRGSRQILINACAYDFLRVGCQKVFGEFKPLFLRDYNGLSFDETWHIMSRFRSSVNSMLYLSQYLAPSSHTGDLTQDKFGKKLECCNISCPFVRPEDKDRYNMRFIRGIVFKCSTCWKQSKDTWFLCEGCAVNNDIKCRKNPPPGTRTKDGPVPDHEFAPYVEDDFVCCLEQVSKNLTKRRDELHQKEDAWVRKFLGMYTRTGAQWLSEPAPRSE
eukprot:PhF_6_TR1997/c0_g1_i1/m.3374/K20103/DDX60; ATP-dependent RNA helicase DDX60